MTEEVTFAASLGVKAASPEELGLTLSGNYDPIPEDMKEAFLAIEENIRNAAASRVAASVQRAMAQGPQLELGVAISGYEYVDLMCLTPRKPGLFPPWVNLPTKIVAGGELIVHRAILFINPLPGPGGTATGRHVLGSRKLRVTFSLLNVTTATAEAPAFWEGEFVGLAPVVTNFYYPKVHPDPGPNPHVYELNVTFDCRDPEQPYAAFATQWWDLDTDPGWPVPVPPGRRVQIPLRYLVYTE